MTLGIIEIIIGLVVYTTLTVVGLFKLLRTSEETIMRKVKEMHTEQDVKITKAESEAEEIRRNYEAKFRGVNQDASNNKLEVMNTIHVLETNMRTSIHTLGDNVTKALNRLEILITQAIGPKQ
jgi:biopolymer transport protein ExbB/TolQ